MRARLWPCWWVHCLCLSQLLLAIVVVAVAAVDSMCTAQVFAALFSR